jgi:uncharacterized protein (TIGR00251 family)
MSLEVKATENGVSVRVRVIPRAKTSQIVGVENGALVIRLAAPPVDGKANQALIEFLGECLGVRKSNIEVRSGEKSRTKILTAVGVTPAALHALAGKEKE